MCISLSNLFSFLLRTRKHLTKYILNRSLEQADFEGTNSSPDIVLRQITPDLPSPSSWMEPLELSTRRFASYSSSNSSEGYDINNPSKKTFEKIIVVCTIENEPRSDSIV